MFVPHWPESLPDPQPMAWLTGIGLGISGILIILGRKPRTTSLILGCIFLLLFLFCHVPYQLINGYISLGGWTNALKLLALAGGSFAVAGSYAFSKPGAGSDTFPIAERLVPTGRILVGIMLVAFGIDHFLYHQFVKTLVPSWIPFPLFWTYFAGIALIGGGISFITKIKIRVVGLLTATMIFIWLLVLHIPRAVTMPEVENGNEITSVFQALAFSGIAVLVAFPLPVTSETPLATFPTSKADHRVKVYDRRKDP